jgi:ABC-2 type transport system ATP-binding protein
MDIHLEAIELKKEFPGVKAVDGISFRVAQGCCFGLLGPNGAGKTTTLEMLEGISRPTAGRILYRGEALGHAYREEIGIQFQSTALQDFQTVHEALAMFASLYRHNADRTELIRLCRLDDILDRDTRKLSGGQRQRLLLAIALVNDPQLVFMDEPTTGLDPQARRNFWGLIKNVLRRGKTVVLTTHYMEEAQQLCDEIVIVDRGRIIAHGAPGNLVAEHLAACVVRLPREALSVGIPLPDGAEERDGLIEIFTGDAEQAVSRLRELGAHLHELRVEKPNLEDLFLKLTGHGLRN